jgi:hypothetical protein
MSSFNKYEAVNRSKLKNPHHMKPTNNSTGIPTQIITNEMPSEKPETKVTK